MIGRRSIYVVFLVSGAAGLTYQIIWARWLALVFGGTTTSISIILSGFMLGLALGSWGVGRWLHRVRNPLRLYAGLELGIGLFAAAFPLLAALCDQVYTGFVNQQTPAIVSLGLRIALSIALLVLPTSLMGATLPVISEFFRREGSAGRTWHAGALYATNTIGAALGTFAASFLLIELVGVRGTSLAAAALNGLVAAWAFQASRRTTAPEFSEQPAPATIRSPRHLLAMSVLAASGAAALASEVLWTRVLTSSIGSSTYAFALILIVYLVGIALGSWVFSLFVKRLRDLSSWLAATQLAISLWMLVAIALFHSLTAYLQTFEGAQLATGEILRIYFFNALFLLPLAVFSGAAFPIATRMLEPRAEEAQGSLVGRAYAWNTLGSVFGSFAAGFVIAPRTDFVQSIHILVAAYAAIAAAAGAYAWLKRVDRRMPVLGLTVVSLLAVGLGGAKIFDESQFAERLKASHPELELLYHRPGLQGIASVVHLRNAPMSVSDLLVNGVGMTRLGTVTKNMAHIPLLAHPDPQDTLVICFGMGTTFRSAMRHGGRVTVVELVPEVIEAFPLFHADALELARDPRSRLIANDGRNYLKISDEKFDVITIDPPPPIDAAGVTHLYSREFVQLAREHLEEGGIFAHWIPGPETSSGVNDLDSFKMLIRTVAEEFSHVRVMSGVKQEGLHVLGSMQPFDVSREKVIERFERRGIKSDAQEWDPMGAAYFSGLQELRAADLESQTVVTDDRPHLEFDLIRIWRAGGTKEIQMSWW